jgi:hypothetical protein
MAFSLLLQKILFFFLILPDRLNCDILNGRAVVDDRYIVALIVKHLDSHQVSAL